MSIMVLSNKYKHKAQIIVLFLLLFVANIFPAQMTEVESKVQPIFQNFQDRWMEFHKGQKGEHIGSITIKFTLSENGEVQEISIDRESNLPARFKIDLITDVGNLKFSHKQGEPNVFTYSGTFNYKYVYNWDWKRALIIAGIAAVTSALLGLALQ